MNVIKDNTLLSIFVTFLWCFKDIHHILLVPPTMTCLDLYDIHNVFVTFWLFVILFFHAQIALWFTYNNHIDRSWIKKWRSRYKAKLGLWLMWNTSLVVETRKYLMMLSTWDKWVIMRYQLQMRLVLEVWPVPEGNPHHR